MERNFPLVSIIIPCRNEEKFIGMCLDSIIANDYPKDKLEILVVDGMSGDKTRKTVAEYSAKYSFIELLENPNRVTPFALNIGIKNSKGSIIARMDAHSEYSKDYVSKLVKGLFEFDADNVGGITKIIPVNKTLSAKAIALVHSSFFGAGNAYYKTKIPAHPIEVDTVFCGCFRKEIFNKIGLFDERMIRNQDLEFNLRLRRADGKIFLIPDIISSYYPKATLWEFAKHNFSDGFWVVYPLKFRLKTFSWRHIIPLIFTASFFVLPVLGIFVPPVLFLFGLEMASYFILNLFFSAKIAIKEKSLCLLFLMIPVFFIRHFFYGLGSAWAVLRLAVRR